MVGASAGATTTVQPGTDAWAAFVGGFVAAEGTFTRSGRSFRFGVGLAAADASMCHQMHRLLGVGGVYVSPRRQPHYDDEVSYHVRRTRDLVEVVVPFMDAHLPASHKRRQYEAWRATLFDHWEYHARLRRPCSVPGCERPRRGKGLCRAHYYALYGI